MTELVQVGKQIVLVGQRSFVFTLDDMWGGCFVTNKSRNQPHLCVGEVAIELEIVHVGVADLLMDSTHFGRRLSAAGVGSNG